MPPAATLLLLSFLLSAHALPFVSRYTLLDYDPVPVSSTRLRRHTDASEATTVEFQLTPNVSITVQLEPDDLADVFALGHRVDVNGADIVELSARGFVRGQVLGDPSSSAHGTLHDGVFDGVVETPANGGILYVERLSKHKKHKRRKGRFHSVLYFDRDIQADHVLEKHFRSRRSSADSAGCGLRASSVRSEMHPRFSDDVTCNHPRSARQASSFSSSNRSPTNNNGRHVEKDAHSGLYNVRTCSLYMQTDQELYKQVFENEGQGSRQRTMEEIYALISNHIRAVNKIYEDTNFNGVTGLTFVVQRVTIFDNSSCEGEVSKYPLDDDRHNPFCEKDVGVSYYLNLNSQKNHTDFCLSYAITYRDFDGGTLGLAWVATAQSGAAGGICEVYKYYNEKSSRVRRSLNTGVITLVNYNNRVPPKVSQLTLAHEIGHSFGSQHDPHNCQPGLPGGNYIMFASATSGDKPNNSKFSSCSVANISEVLNVVLRVPPEVLDQQQSPALYRSGSKRNCLTLRDTAYCGNQLVEEREKCDCGFSEDECNSREGSEPGQSCCHPREAGSSLMCTLRHSASCSPTEGKCCSPGCRFLRGDECLQESECAERATCNGNSAHCPPPRPKSGEISCLNNTKLCSSGECSLSICDAAGYTECFLAEGDSRRKCELACLKNGVCTSSYSLPELSRYYQQPHNKGIMLRPGSPCDNYMGYCDVFHKCVSVDSNGPLERLRDLLFNKETFETIGKWIEVNWWAVLLIAIALVLFMALFIKCCAVHTPSTNPSRHPPHSIYQTLRHPSTLVRRRRIPAPRGEAPVPPQPSRHRERGQGHRSDRERQGRPSRSSGEREPSGGRRHRRHRDRANPSAPADPVAPGITLASGQPPPPMPDPPPPYAACVSDSTSPGSRPSTSTTTAPAQYAGGPPRGRRKGDKPGKRGGASKHV